MEERREGTDGEMKKTRERQRGQVGRRRREAGREEKDAPPTKL